MCLTIVPLYQAELSPPYARGLLVGSHGAFLAIGYNIASWVGLGCFFASNPVFAWRFPLALQVLFPLVLLAGSPWLPQSPRWLVAKGHLPEAQSILERLHSSPEDPYNTFAVAEFDQIVSQIELERRQYSERHSGKTTTAANKTFLGDLRELFAHAPFRKRAVLGFTLMFGAQCTGVLVINNYQIILFPVLGVSPGLSLGLYSVYLAIALVGNSSGGSLYDVSRSLCMTTQNL
jgi:MFS family permease